ncbi:uncharacterized protein LOC128610270 isoform X4 [Ictalurus furcatus]|uniref:uncharacterized protein LOC128610270 isoform X4 n=1 Tax=Ictalurus furcatus TaxID=66913 RepID=UPI0023501BBB|nr:uncharacterized protein LOC128610270 isoform X4 [Ictalurus furcatus]XP_053485471.1 uncharacterized protein LOC128610270 isoform X4 [Ictalurus furcatus]
MLGRCSDLNHAAKEGGNQQNDAFSQDKYKSTTAQVQNTEVSAADWVTLRRRTLIGAVTVSALIILALLGGIVITAHRLMEVLDQLNTVSDVTKEFPSLSRKEGIVPEEVWRWIVAAKGTPVKRHCALRLVGPGCPLPRVPQVRLQSPCDPV